MRDTPRAHARTYLAQDVGFPLVVHMLPPSGKRMRTEDGSPRGTGAEDTAVKAIRLVSYNIRNGRNGGLEAALRAMAQANVDLGVLQETKKVTDGTYTRWSSDYHVHATDAPSTQQGGVALIYRDSDLFQVEAMQTFGPRPACRLTARNARTTQEARSSTCWGMTPHSSKRRGTT